MKSCSKIFALFFAFLLLVGSVAQAQDKPKGMSRKAKGAIGGGVGGAVLGSVVGGKKGAVIGAGVGAVGGGAHGRSQDKK